MGFEPQGRVQVQMHHCADVHGEHRLLERVLFPHRARQPVARLAAVVRVLVLSCRHQHVRIAHHQRRRRRAAAEGCLRVALALTAPRRLHGCSAALDLATARRHTAPQRRTRTAATTAFLPRLGDILACRWIELAPVIQEEPLGLDSHQLGLQRLEQRLLLARRQHVVRHQPVQRLVAHRILLQRRGVAARGERPVLLRLVHATPQQLHRRVHRQLPARAQQRALLRLGLGNGLIGKHREAIVQLLTLDKALCGEVAKAWARRLQVVLAQHGEGAAELLGEDKRLRQPIHVVRSTRDRHKLVGEEDGILVHVFSD